jgi:hypothetical protein
MPPNHGDDSQKKQQAPQSEKLKLSERDSVGVLDLSENPSDPAERLTRAAAAARKEKRVQRRKALAELVALDQELGLE